MDLDIKGSNLFLNLVNYNGKSSLFSLKNKNSTILFTLAESLFSASLIRITSNNDVNIMYNLKKDSNFKYPVTTCTTTVPCSTSMSTKHMPTARPTDGHPPGENTLYSSYTCTEDGIPTKRPGPFNDPSPPKDTPKDEPKPEPKPEPEATSEATPPAVTPPPADPVPHDDDDDDTSPTPSPSDEVPAPSSTSTAPVVEFTGAAASSAGMTSWRWKVVGLGVAPMLFM